MSLRIFAAILVGAIPTETTRPVRSSTRRFSARATSIGAPSSRSVPVRSRNASSSDSGSTTGLKLSKTLRTIARNLDVAFHPARARKSLAGRACAPAPWASRTARRTRAPRMRPRSPRRGGCCRRRSPACRATRDYRASRPRRRRRPCRHGRSRVPRPRRLSRGLHGESSSCVARQRRYDTRLRRRVRRCGRNRGCRRRDRRRRPERSPATRAATRSISATRSRWPTAYCGIESGQRRTQRQSRCGAYAEQTRVSPRAPRHHRVVIERIIPICSAPPRNTRSRTVPSGARPANFRLEKLPAIILRPSITGTTKPKLSRRPGKIGDSIGEIHGRGRSVTDLAKRGPVRRNVSEHPRRGVRRRRAASTASASKSAPSVARAARSALRLRKFRQHLGAQPDRIRRAALRAHRRACASRRES